MHSCSCNFRVKFPGMNMEMWSCFNRVCCRQERSISKVYLLSYLFLSVLFLSSFFFNYCLVLFMFSRLSVVLVWKFAGGFLSILLIKSGLRRVYLPIMVELAKDWARDLLDKCKPLAVSVKRFFCLSVLSSYYGNRVTLFPDHDSATAVDTTNLLESFTLTTCAAIWESDSSLKLSYKSSFVALLCLELSRCFTSPGFLFL